MRLILHDRVRFLAALCVLAALLCIPITWVWAQSRLETDVARDSQRLDDLAARVDSLDRLPDHVARLEEKVSEVGGLLSKIIGGGISAFLAAVGHVLWSHKSKRESDDRLIETLVERLKP